MFNSKYKKTMELLTKEIDDCSEAVRYFQDKLYNEDNDKSIDAMSCYELMMEYRHRQMALNKLRSKILCEIES